MCGIAGIADSSGRPIDEGTLRSMCGALAHRGPDGEGYYVAPSSGRRGEAGNAASIGLGMRRLAIIDLATGQQPIHNEDRTVWVVLNGEIYNYPELRAELESKGHRFATKTDTEVIVHAYEEHGCNVPKLLRGMFAFALWDEREQRLLLARDRVGKKPLLYCVRGNKLIFSSEFQAILRHPDVPREPDHRALFHYLSFMCVPAPSTAFRGVRKLEPAHLLVWKRGRPKVERYWSLDFRSKAPIPEQEAGERAVELLREAVRVRLMSDVPLGAFLSGGIDSSAVVALMSELCGARVKTFSIGFDEQNFSEISHARRIADAFGTDHHEFIVRPNAVDVLPTLVRHYGEPYADSSAIPTYYLSKMTRQHVTVALNGDGGDECFAGYERYSAMRLAEYYHRFPRLVRKQLFERAIGLLPEERATRSRLDKALRFLRVMSLPRDARYLRWTSAIDEDLKKGLCTNSFLELAGHPRTVAILESSFAGNGRIDIVDRSLMADTACYLPNDLLVKVDIASMAVSLEARSPFLDHRLMEFAATLPARYKLRRLTTKYLLKKALRGLLPSENLTRSKMGFGVPVSAWLRRELTGLLNDTLLSERAMSRGYFQPQIVRYLVDQHQSGRRDYGHQLWTLLILELWHREFIDKRVE